MAQVESRSRARVTAYTSALIIAVASSIYLAVVPFLPASPIVPDPGRRRARRALTQEQGHLDRDALSARLLLSPLADDRLRVLPAALCGSRHRRHPCHGDPPPSVHDQAGRAELDGPRGPLRRADAYPGLLLSHTSDRRCRLRVQRVRKPRGARDDIPLFPHPLPAAGECPLLHDHERRYGSR